LIWFEDRGELMKRGEVGIHPRIGVDYAGEWAKKPWRFRLRTMTTLTRTGTIRSSDRRRSLWQRSQEERS
jgi:hypothetical protein